MERKTFRSRISVLLIIVLLCAFLPAFISIIDSEHIFTSRFYNLSGALVFIIVLLFGMRYVVTDKQLLLKLWGITLYRVPISQIFSVERSYNPISSPAASLKRLSVQLRDKSLPRLVSPVREQEFLGTLKEINPNIDICVDDKKAWYRVWDWDI